MPWLFSGGVRFGFCRIRIGLVRDSPKGCLGFACKFERLSELSHCRLCHRVVGKNPNLRCALGNAKCLCPSDHTTHAVLTCFIRVKHHPIDRNREFAHRFGSLFLGLRERFCFFSLGNFFRRRFGRYRISHHLVIRALVLNVRIHILVAPLSRFRILFIRVRSRVIDKSKLRSFFSAYVLLNLVVLQWLGELRSDVTCFRHVFLLN
nr:MAG TPA: hypothetical protein [Caudoviricetes sp.]